MMVNVVLLLRRTAGSKAAKGQEPTKCINHLPSRPPMEVVCVYKKHGWNQVWLLIINYIAVRWDRAEGHREKGSYIAVEI